MRVIAFLLVLLWNAGQSASSEVEPWKLQEADLRARMHCTSGQPFVIATAIPEASPDVLGVAWLSDCSVDRMSLLVWPPIGSPSELDEHTYIGNQRVEARFVRSGNRRSLLLTTIAYERSDSENDFEVRVDDPRKMERLLIATSSDEPRILETPDDGQLRIVIFRDPFSIRWTGLPNWPVVIEVGDGVSLPDLSEFPALVREEKRRTDEQLAKYQQKLKWMNLPDEDTVAERRIVSGLRSQSEALARRIGLKSGD